MLRGNRDNIAAAFRLAVYLLIGASFLTVVWQISGVYAERRENAEHRARQYADSTDRDIASACGGAKEAALIECVAKEIEASREDQRTEYDLQAQQDSADAAFWILVVSLLTLITTGLALWFVKRTLDATWKAVDETGEATEAMRSANEIADDTAKRQLRAYVIGKDYAITDFRVGGKPAFVVKIHNFGQTPANEVRCVTIVRATGEPVERHKLRFREVRRTGIFSNSVLGPGDFHPHINAMDGAINQYEWEMIASGGMNMIFAGIISYRDAFGKRHLSTFKYFFAPPEDIKNTAFDLCACPDGNKAN